MLLHLFFLLSFLFFFLSGCLILSQSILFGQKGRSPLFSFLIRFGLVTKGPRVLSFVFPFVLVLVEDR